MLSVCGIDGGKVFGARHKAKEGDLCLCSVVTVAVARHGLFKNLRSLMPLSLDVGLGC